jgi:exonuclease III
MMIFMESTAQNKRKRMNNITIYHQNIRSLTNKSDELSINLQLNHNGPHLICLIEHHLKESEIAKFSLDGYKLASSFCRRESLEGGVCILITNNITFQSINLKQFCHEKILEICAVKLHLKTIKLIIFCIYTAPAGNLDQFYDTLENILKHFLQPHVTYLICGDLNINLFQKVMMH